MFHLLSHQEIILTISFLDEAAMNANFMHTEQIQ